MRLRSVGFEGRGFRRGRWRDGGVMQHASEQGAARVRWRAEPGVAVSRSAEMWASSAMVWWTAWERRAKTRPGSPRDGADEVEGGGAGSPAGSGLRADCGDNNSARAGTSRCRHRVDGRVKPGHDDGGWARRNGGWGEPQRGAGAAPLHFLDRSVPTRTYARRRTCGRRRSHRRRPDTAASAMAGSRRGCSRSGSNTLMRRAFSR